MKTIRLYIICIHLMFIATIGILNGQNLSLKITISDQEGHPLPGAPVQLTNPDDSIAVYEITNTSGIAEFSNFKDGLYILNITYIGFKPIETTLRVTEISRTIEFIMSSDAISLGGVTITAKKPLIRQEDDKMIIDPEPIANTSTNTLEILESTPGLYVDQDGGIFLSSATPATVYINGREQKMSTQDINTILRSIPPGSVERIEVLRTPSTKYDASSSGGIINIVLKKGVKIGRFGSVNTGMNQGVYGNRFAGFSLNSSSDKTTSYLNVNYNDNMRLDEINSVRNIYQDTALHQQSESRIKNNQLYLGYGMTYDQNKTGFSYDGRINIGKRNTNSDNSNNIFSPDMMLLSESNNTIENISQFISIQQDFGMIYKIDTTGSELDTKLSYSFNSNGSTQEYFTDYIIPIDTLISGGGDNTQQRHFIVFQSDLTQHLPLKFKLEAGIKSTMQYYQSDAGFFLNVGNIQVADNQRTNSFNYTEYINAAYAQASRPLFAGLQMKAGIRMESTNMNGHQTIPTDTGFVLKRTDWFPYVYLSRKVIELMGVELFGYMIYRKTINRPGYEDLNPHIRFIDQFLYESGNPSLKPQFTENIELNVSYNDFPILAIGRNYTKDIFSMVTYQDPENLGVLVRTYDNLGQSKETYFRGMVGIPPGNKYFFAIGAQYNMNEYNGIYDNEPLSFSNGSWRFFTFHSLNLFKNTKITASGFMMTNGVWNFYELENFGQFNLGLTQTFFNKKLTITLNARDILKTNINKFELNQGSIYSYGSRYTDNRRIGINIRYNFGISKKDEKKNMFGIEEENGN